MKLSDEEQLSVWDRVYALTKFRPSIKEGVVPFHFDVDYRIYDISEVMESPDDERMDTYIRGVDKAIRSACPEDGMIYALDWQHDCYKYNPHRERHLSYIPDGDYYFFMAEDLSWGFLTHPWQQKVWIYGEKLIKELDRDFIPGFIKVK
ncbi:MAG: DUF2716 domain-containing protein [Lachnospira sp.]